MRRMMIPGEFITEKKYKFGEGVFKEGDKLYASTLGLLDERKDYLRIIPLSGKYIPSEGDFVIGKIEDPQFSFWRVDINSPYYGILNASDYFKETDPFQSNLGEILGVGDTIFAIVREVTPTKSIYITMKERGARTLKGGRLLEINPRKIPRVIGRKSSMVSMIKRETKCEVLVGQNGRVWIKGKEEFVDIATNAIKEIDVQAHTSGLTDRIKTMIIKERERI